MCATSGAGNAGLDSTAIGSIFRLGMPESMSDFFQEKGRAGRYPNAHPTENRYTICFSIEDLLSNNESNRIGNQRILSKEKSYRSDTNGSCVGIG